MSSRRRITTLPTTLSLALAALLFAATGRAPGAPPARKGDADHWRSLETLLEQAVERASASTVAIVTSTSANGVRLRTGTAVTEGLVLTDATFLEGLAEPITVIDAQGRRFEAHRAGLDQRLRIAALRVSGGALVGVERAPPARPGLFAIACGRARPGSRRATPTLGIISAIGRFSGRATQVSCKLSTANAGGPVVDLDGRAFGVAIRLTRRTGDDSGVGFCVPWSMINPILPALADGAQLRAAELGLLVPEQDLPGTRGVPIVAVRSGGPAARTQLCEGDLIVGLDDAQIDRLEDLSRAVAKLIGGQTIKLRIERSGRRFEVEFETKTRAP